MAERFGAYLPPEQVAAVKLVAAHRGDTTSGIIRHAILEYLDRVLQEHPEWLEPLQPRRSYEHTAT